MFSTITDKIWQINDKKYFKKNWTYLIFQKIILTFFPSFYLTFEWQKWKIRATILFFEKDISNLFFPFLFSFFIFTSIFLMTNNVLVLDLGTTCLHVYLIHMLRVNFETYYLKRKFFFPSIFYKWNISKYFLDFF